MNCAICYDHTRHGHNPDPLLDAGESVCDRCNSMFVIPRRLGIVFSVDHARIVAARLKEAE